jgi:FtsP/CotA-like multicopper oxidase with cupredoxin domain/plastocyanin
MPDRVYWIQLENRPWDASPNNIDRMHGHDIEHSLAAHGGAPPITVALSSPETGVVSNREMYLPTNAGTQLGAGGVMEWKVVDALVLRRYTENWAQPDDRKVNPWDLNEPDPTDTGTMGTIPGPTLECNVGDRMIVHFRNKDLRPGKDVTVRTHSLHPHGIVFAPQYDGAFPLTPPDPTQPIPPVEAPLWASIGVNGGLKQGDRVPPGATFTYTWDTFGWPATAGVWHYHDHSICDAENVLLGALGFLVIHNPADPDDVIEQDLPFGEPNGSLTRLSCFGFGFEIPLLPHQLEGLNRVKSGHHHGLVPATAAAEETYELLHGRFQHPGEHASDEEEPGEHAHGEQPHGNEDHGPRSPFALESGPFMLELTRDLGFFHRFCFRRYIDPPAQLQILQYYHELPGTHMTINGRRFLGNTPTVIAGLETKMRFGLAAMNSLTFHTFHLHGHRWTIPGPQGTDPGTIQSSAQVQAVSQFEDTRLFGPANSFAFTINQGSFMGSRFTPDPTRAPGAGEWHMHCHVLNHMMPGGMMGSLLVIQGGEVVLPLALGQPCLMEDVAPANTIVVFNTAFNPPVLNVAPGTMVTFDFQEPFHTVTTPVAPVNADPIEINNGGGPADAVPAGSTRMVVINGNPGAMISYICGIHGAMMSGMIHIV